MRERSTACIWRALLHDIGKIGIDDAILRKMGTLSDEEYEHIKAHVSIGHRILHEVAIEGSAARGVPPPRIVGRRGLSASSRCADRIPLAARIVAVADAFDAMSSDRPYRKAMPDETVDRILETGAGHPMGSRCGLGILAASATTSAARVAICGSRWTSN